jgi:hypothetical protein
MGAFAFRLEREGGTPADPPTLSTAVPTWRCWRSVPDAERQAREPGSGQRCSSYVLIGGSRR